MHIVTLLKVVYIFFDFIRFPLKAAFFSFTLWAIGVRLFTGGCKVEVFGYEDDAFGRGNCELNSEIMLLFLIQKCRQVSHFVIRFSSKLLKDWGCILRDLFLNFFGEFSFRKLSCSTRVRFSRVTNTHSLIFYRSNNCSYNLTYPCTRPLTCLIANFACSTVLMRLLKDN